MLHLFAEKKLKSNQLFFMITPTDYILLLIFLIYIFKFIIISKIALKKCNYILREFDILDDSTYLSIVLHMSIERSCEYEDRHIEVERINWAHSIVFFSNIIISVRITFCKSNYI